MRRPATILFALCLLLATGPLAAQQRTEKPQNAPESESQHHELKVIMLRYMQANGFSGVLRNVIGGEPDARIAVDSRTNSVIVFATPETLKTAERLAQVLDTKEVPQAEQ